MTIFGSIKGKKLVYDAFIRTLGLKSYFRYDNHRKRRENYVWSKMVDFMCNHSEINFPKSREFVGTEQGRLPNGHCAHQGQGLQQTVSLGSRPSNLSSWVFWHVITRAPTAYHHLSKLYRSGNWTVKFCKNNFSFELLTSVWRPPWWQGFLKLIRLTNPARWDVERVQNAWESIRRAESQLARGVHVLCKI